MIFEAAKKDGFSDPVLLAIAASSFFDDGFPPDDERFVTMDIIPCENALYLTDMLSTVRPLESNEECVGVFRRSKESPDDVNFYPAKESLSNAELQVVARTSEALCNSLYKANR